MDIYWIDRCWYGQLLGRLMQVWTVTGQTDENIKITGQTIAGMGSYWIYCSKYGVTGQNDAGRTVIGQIDAGMDSYWIE